MEDKDAMWRELSHLLSLEGGISQPVNRQSVWDDAVKVTNFLKASTPYKRSYRLPTVISPVDPPAEPLVGVELNPGPCVRGYICDNCEKLIKKPIHTKPKLSWKVDKSYIGVRLCSWSCVKSYADMMISQPIKEECIDLINENPPNPPLVGVELNPGPTCPQGSDCSIMDPKHQLNWIHVMLCKIRLVCVELNPGPTVPMEIIDLTSEEEERQSPVVDFSHLDHYIVEGVRDESAPLTVADAVEWMSDEEVEKLVEDLSEEELDAVARDMPMRDFDVTVNECLEVLTQFAEEYRYKM